MTARPIYPILRAQCGLSIAEAAAFHRVREDTVRKWSGARNPPEGVLQELQYLYEQIEEAGSDPFKLDALPCDGARDAARGIAFLLANDGD